MSVRSQTLQPKDWASKAPVYMDEAKALNVLIKPPDINKSELGFCIKDDNVYFGLNGIREVGKVAARNIIEAASNTPFYDVLGFLARVDRQKVTRKTYAALVKAGCFDYMGYQRQDLLDTADEYYDKFNDFIAYKERQIEIVEQAPILEENLKLIEEREILRTLKKDSERKRNPGRQLTSEEEIKLNFLDSLGLKRKQPLKEFVKPEPFTELERHKTLNISIAELIEQSNYIGCYLQKHPARIIFPETNFICDSELSETILIAGTITNVKIINTKKGQPMAFVEISDETAMAELIIFPKTYNYLNIKGLIPNINDIIKVQGKCEAIEPKIKMIVDKIQIYKPAPNKD